MRDRRDLFPSLSMGLSLLYTLFLFIPISYCISYSIPNLPTVCNPCLRPHSTHILWLPFSRSPCIHPGQPIFEWPSNSTCPEAVSIRSEQISVEDGIVFAKEKLCFFLDFQDIDYWYQCQGKTKRETFRIGHSRFSKQVPPRRQKRWVRRRNPHSSAILFQQDRYVREMLEDSPVSSLVVSVRATHVAAQSIYYSMVAPQDSRSHNYFTLDTVTGDIRLAKSLDREILDKHVLKVTAFERLDQTVSSSTTVVVDVLDVQDNSPVFERDSYFADIREDAPIGTTVLSVFARDLDSGLNGEVEYSLAEGVGRDLLVIHAKSGVVQTAAPLDRETLSLIRLDVVAADRGVPPRSSTAMVEIGIVDVNDNAPVFEQDMYNVSISENATLPAVVASVRATDKDSGMNGKVHYSIVSSAAVPLTIDYSSGDVTLRERLDAKLSPITVLVRAKDGAQPALTSTVSLTLHIEDINDHAPRFIASQKQIFLEENVAVGEEVSKVFAIDDDSGQNGRIRYTLDGSDDFAIDAESGVVRTMRLLDRERTAEYELTITASDGGSPVQNTSTVMSVVVKDVNDNAPRFEKEVYNLTLSEETERGTQILALKAEDKDENQKITYRIESISKDIVALIDMGEQGALLTLSRRLHSLDNHIRLEVSATDQGGLQSKCVVNIVVDDVNSAPFFTEHPFSVRILEDAPIGFPVVTMKAEDSDRGSNAAIRYSIESKEFRIDPESGQITVAATLDREECSSYTLTVTAVDGAEKPLETQTQIEIIIDDVNDNVPRFSSDNYEASIPEDIAVGTSFLQVTANDADAGPSGLVDYFLNESDSTVALDLFRLDRTSGTLRVNGRLDRETYSSLILPVIARDRGVPPLSSHSTISISLSDVNDNAPTFNQKSYDLYVAENSPAGTVVGTISATDPDEGENAVMQFRIFGGSDAKLFDLEADESGTVRILTRAEFDYEGKSNKFYLEVQASSGQLSSTVPVRIHVSDVNDNRPILKDFVVLVTSFEDVEGSLDIGNIPAYDPDQNATLEFFLEENDILMTDKSSGRLTMKQRWRRGMQAQFKTCVSDGPNTVCSSLRFEHSHVVSDWLREAVTLSIRGISIDDFWDPAVYDRLRQSIASIDSWDPSSIHVLGTRNTKEGVVVDIVVVHKGIIVRAWKVEDILKSEARRLEKISLLGITVVSDESCAKEPCPYYQKCRQTLKYSSDSELHETDNFISRTLKTLSSFVCECPDGFSSSEDLPGQCDLRLDQCYSNPCKNNATCVPLESGFRCECHGQWRGDRCEISTHSLTCLPGYCMSGSACELTGGQMMCRHCKYGSQDTDGRCRLRSLGFQGNGIVNVNRDPGRLQWTLELSIATIATDGVILFSGSRDSDHVELSFQDRLLRAQFSLGGKIKTLRMETERTNRINNGQWHKVRLDYYDRRLTLSQGDCDTFAALHSHGAAPCATQAKIELPSKCLDPTVPCFRFLDLSNGIFLGGRPGQNRKIEEPYIGCIANLTLDGTLIDFSSLPDMDKIGSVSEGCSPLADYCREATCASNSQCVNKWGGYNCRCQHSVHVDGECHTGHLPSHLRPFSFSEDESFVSFQSETSAPLSLSFEFRTSRSDTQLMVAEFDHASAYYRIELDDGQFRAWVGPHSVVVPSPEAPTGQWCKVEVEVTEEAVITTIDGLYKAEINVSLLDRTLTSVYTGLAPSTGHPSRFEGCLRDVNVNGEHLTIHEKGKVRIGCSPGNRCSVDGVCPKESVCHRQWDRHQCICHKGFVGDTCLPACSLRGVCGGDGFCQASNSTRGYDCQCHNGLTGPNCQLSSPSQRCPSGWFGQFPHCRRCDCDKSRGFASQCDTKDGTCLCQKFHYSSGNRCVPCECGLGASSLECGRDGQCPCRGQAIGRRCDRCRDASQVLEPKSLKCITIKDRCPSQIESGIQWPTTIKGGTARASCKGAESGLATRQCGSDSRWTAVNSYNCTRNEFSRMVNKFDALSPSELLSMLSNATSSADVFSGRNLEIAREAASRLVRTQINLPLSQRFHLRDVSFSASLLVSLSTVLSNESPTEYLTLANLLAHYGKSTFEVHEKLPFLEPFLVSTDEMIFALDRLDFSNTVPKFNNFIDSRPTGFPQIQIQIKQAEQVMYSILPYPRCVRCENPIVTVFANTTLPIRVEFPLDDDNGWKYPECVVQKFGSSLSWVSRGASLIGLNTTHAVCEYEKSGVYTIFVKPDKGAYLRLSHSDTISSPVLAGIALLLCALSFICTLARKGIRTQLIRLGFILFFALNAVNIYFVHKTSVNQLFCPVRNAILSFTSCAPFAWLFLYSLHMYRLLADGNTRSSCTICLLLGLVLPCLLACVSFLFASQCSLLPESWMFWLIVIPIALFLLLSFYASATSLLVSMNKQFDVVMLKFNLRKALFQHFILSTLTLLYTTMGIFLPLFAFSTPLQELVCNITLVVVSLYILVWSFCPSAKTQSNGVTMWLEPQKDGMMQSLTAAEADSPLLARRGDMEVSDWMGDVIPSDPFLTSTPTRVVREYEDPREYRERERLDVNPIASSILSPAEKILQDGLGHVYGNVSTLPRFRCDQDEADDAYYTYTAQRKNRNTTFNR